MALSYIASYLKQENIQNKLISKINKETGGAIHQFFCTFKNVEKSIQLYLYNYISISILKYLDINILDKIVDKIF